jgi:hypothetical protein
VIVGGLVAVGTDGAPARWWPERVSERLTSELAGGESASEVALPSGAVSVAGDRSQRTASTCGHRGGPVDCVRWVADVGTARRDGVVAVGASVLVAEADGGVRNIGAGHGRTRWRIDTPEPVGFHPEVAATVPVTAGGRTAFVDLASGRTIGSFEGPVEAAAASGAWLLTRDGAAIETRAVNGTVSWRRDIPPDALARLTPHGAYLTTQETLRADRITRLGMNTGEPRWDRRIEGRVAAIHALGTATLVVVEDTGSGAAIVLLDERGELVTQHPIEGRATSVTVAGDGGAAVVTEGGPGALLHRVEAASGTITPPVWLARGARSTLPPAISGAVVAVAHREPSPVVTVVDRGNGLIRTRLHLEEPPDEIALPSDATLLTIIGGEVTGWSLATGGRRWQLELDTPTRVVASRPLVVHGGTVVHAIEPDAVAAAPARRLTDSGRVVDHLGERRRR